MLPTEIAPGFRVAPPQSGFVEVNGPIYYRLADGELTMALLVEPRHCNPARNCHGAILFGLADQTMALTSALKSGPRKMLITINLTCDFLAPAPAGSWVEAHAVPLRRSKSLAFVQSILRVGETDVLRANGIFRVPSEDTPGYDLSQVLT